ncbi:MAG TPA: class I SAM-dependent methyltransferase [Catalimonadaceae bacterium]|nr:class I SAM-dependent methyltransferase [Catalimonadaceae bacterium]
MEHPDYISINRESWNERTRVHVDSEFYDVEGFKKGNNPLKEIEIGLLGDVQGKRILHLQCHFGQDTLALARMGAEVTGVDVSDLAIEKAIELAFDIDEKASFICCDLYDLPNQLVGHFDIVFTSYGTIGWLPDLNKWAEIVALYLKPGGRFVFAEFHPVVWMFDNDFSTIGYRYFNSGPIIETESGTYADTSASIEQQYITWNHGIGEVLSALLRSGIRITSFQEFDYSPYNCFKGAIEAEPGRFRIEKLGNLIPMVYALDAEKMQ